ncbi:D-alanyl-D-alanine carboxypeptidase family protein [Bartonella ancashensis]|uniref:D-alanyl-D-alanine carboxypeptidase n=1 Tax=Bartonella ancashensis TaxID=1318743 RepID=A0A0M4LHZ3_9HYPH|nr:D-alanyl-D-alanine carboxypeptidase family protein [Bartonella ancashensis]ALE03230.1 D-alanyl-D-alanine carboxypeptidase [Bartonella ancashensis]
MRQLFYKFPLIYILSMANTLALSHPFISVDVATGRILEHNQAFERLHPASLTQLMTVYIAFRAMSMGKISPEKFILISKNAKKSPSNNSDYKAGSTLTLDAALSITLVKSANDLAIAIGEAISGSQEAFVKQMNAEAQRLGMFGTHFVNASGMLDPENYSTARDLALLAVQIRREFPQYAHYFSTPAIDFGANQKIQYNSNNLIGRFDGIDGMAASFICSSGFSLAASATRNGRTIIAIILGAKNINEREEKAAQLLNKGFSYKGSLQSTLATLEPYGIKIKQITDMERQMCSHETAKKQLDSNDDDHNIAFTSPLIATAPSSIIPLLIYSTTAPKTHKVTAKILRNIPVPRKRPGT